MKTLALFLLSLLATGTATTAEGRPPNIVIIFTDDLAYGDIEPFGAEGYATPNLARMAAEGTTFTDFYVSAPVCSASRAALLTGCYHERVGINGALAPGSRIGLHQNEVTIAELCKSEGNARRPGRPPHRQNRQRPPRAGKTNRLNPSYTSCP